MGVVKLVDVQKRKRLRLGNLSFTNKYFVQGKLPEVLMQVALSPCSPQDMSIYIIYAYNCHSRRRESNKRRLNHVILCLDLSFLWIFKRVFQYPLFQKVFEEHHIPEKIEYSGGGVLFRNLPVGFLAFLNR